MSLRPAGYLRWGNLSSGRGRRSREIERQPHHCPHGPVTPHSHPSPHVHLTPDERQRDRLAEPWGLDRARGPPDLFLGICRVERRPRHWRWGLSEQQTSKKPVHVPPVRDTHYDFLPRVTALRKGDSSGHQTPSFVHLRRKNPLVEIRAEPRPSRFHPEHFEGSETDRASPEHHCLISQRPP